MKDDFAACAMSRKLNTVTLDFPGKSKLLGGKCFSALSYEGAGVYLLGIAHLSRFGIDQVDFHQGTPFRQGDFHFSETAYPNGIADFRKTSEVFHRHGFSTGLHTYAEFLSSQSKYVTPVPHKDLDVMQTFTLSTDLGVDDQSVPVDESTADVSVVTGFFVRNSTVVRIDDELILFESPSRSAPYGFASCRRGAYGTKASTHVKGAPVEQMTQMFHLFAPGGRAVVYDAIGNEVGELRPDVLSFDLPSGDMTLKFSDASGSISPASVRITLCVKDDKLLR